MGTATKYTEVELVTSLKNQDAQAFSYLYDNYSGALYTIIIQIVSDEEFANDVLQEVFVHIWRKIDTYHRSKGRLFTWMLNIARNLSIDTVRSRGYQNSKRNRELPTTECLLIDGFVQQHIDAIGLKRVLYKLKREYQTLIDLAYFKGYTHEEIAEMENIPLGTVKTRIRTALIQLRIQLI